MALNGSTCLKTPRAFENASKPKKPCPLPMPLLFDPPNGKLLLKKYTALWLIEVPPARLAELAARRAEAVVKVLVEEDGADAQRIETMPTEGDQLPAKSPRADFQLQ